MPHRRALALGLAAVACLGVLAAPSTPTVRGVATRVAVATGLEWPVSFAFVPEGAPLGPLRAPRDTILYDERLSGNVTVVAGGQPLGRLANVTVYSMYEQGLLGLALDPDYATSPWAYVYYTYWNATWNGTENRVSRLWLGTPGIPGQPTEEVLLDAIPASFYHNGGILGFAPGGTLFVTTGDAGDSAAAQDNASLAGKVLRIARDGTIPADNPIPGSPVYTLGHRNVFGLAFHPVTGEAFVSENGPAENDEVNILEPGKNYGWPVVTGPAGDPRFVDPAFTFAAVVAPTGLAFYTGAASPTWQGSLFLGDWNYGDLHRLGLGGPPYRAILGNETVDSVGSLGRGGVLDVEDGPDGYLYYSTMDTIYRVNGTAGPLNGGGSRGTPSLALPLVLIGVASVAVLAVLVLLRERRRRPPAGRGPG